MQQVKCNWCDWHGTDDQLKTREENGDIIETCPKCGDNSEGKIMDIPNPCLYCDDQNDPNNSEHFECDMCSKGMCDDCYQSMKEHDGHYHRPYESEEWADERQPEYVCDQCIGQYKYNSDNQ